MQLRIGNRREHTRRNKNQKGIPCLDFSCPQCKTTLLHVYDLLNRQGRASSPPVRHPSLHLSLHIPCTSGPMLKEHKASCMFCGVFRSGRLASRYLSPWIRHFCIPPIDCRSIFLVFPPSMCLICVESGL